MLSDESYMFGSILLIVFKVQFSILMSVYWYPNITRDALFSGTFLQLTQLNRKSFHEQCNRDIDQNVTHINIMKNRKIKDVI